LLGGEVGKIVAVNGTMDAVVSMFVAPSTSGGTM